MGKRILKSEESKYESTNVDPVNGRVRVWVMVALARGTLTAGGVRPSQIRYRRPLPLFLKARPIGTARS